MKLAFSTLGCPTWSFERILDNAKSFGFSGVEIRGVEGEMQASKIPCFAIGRQQESRRMALEHGAQLIGFGASSSFHDPSKLESALNEGRAAIDVAVALGMRFVRVFGDKIGPEDDEETIIARAAEGIGELCRYAGGTDVSVVLEVHGDFNIARRVLGVANRVQSDRFGVLWDVEHSDKTYGDNYLEFYAAIRPFIRHVHLKDHVRGQGEFRLCSIGEGDIPLIPILRTLEKDAYGGYCSLEWEKTWHPDLRDPALEFPHFVRYIQDNL